MRRWHVMAAASLLWGGCTGSGPLLETTSSSDDTTSATSDSATSSSTGEPEGWVPILEVGEEVGAFMSVWGPAPDDIYFVGGQGAIDPESSRGAVYHLDAGGLAPESVPGSTPMLNWVYGVDDEVWAVGQDGGAIVRRDGSWTAVSTGTTETLWGVWGPTTNDLWAVGGDGLGSDPVLLHWDGSDWTPETLDALAGVETFGLFKVWGTAPDDVILVGDRGAHLRGSASAWSLIPAESPADLIALWGTGPDEVLVVGGRASARVTRWDGSAWAGATLAFPGLNGIWMDEGGRSTAVGNTGTILRFEPGSIDGERETSNTGEVLHAVFGFEGGPRYAVGGNLIGEPPFTGLILRNAAP